MRCMLLLLHLQQELLAGKDAVELIVQCFDHNLRLQIDLIVILRTRAVLFLRRFWLIIISGA